MDMVNRYYVDRKQGGLNGALNTGSNRRRALINARKDCEDCDPKTGMLDEIPSEIHLEGDLDETQRERLLEIATRCPVHRTFSSEIKIRTSEV